jgi:hypothetical protein
MSDNMALRRKAGASPCCSISAPFLFFDTDAGDYLIPDPAVGRVRRVLHLDPMFEFAGTTGTIAALRDDAFEAQVAGGTE